MTDHLLDLCGALLFAFVENLAWVRMDRVLLVQDQFLVTLSQSQPYTILSLELRCGYETYGFDLNGGPESRMTSRVFTRRECFLLPLLF